MGRKRIGGGNEDRRINLNYAQIRCWFDEGKTAIEIANIVGCSTSPIKHALKKLGLKRPAKCRPGVRIGASNPAWKGGRRVRSDGYVIVWTPKGERLEHQIVMENSIGRELRAGEVVHHKDGNKGNNDHVNLQLTTQSAHIREHLKEMHAARYGK